MSEEPGAVTEHAGPDCCDFARRISDLHDGRWPVESCDCAEVEAHLAECPRCAELRDDYRAISLAAEVIRETPVAEADAGRISRRVRARLRRRVFVRRLRWTGAGVGFAAAAAAVLFAVILHEGPASDADSELVAEAPPAPADPHAGHSHDVAQAPPLAPAAVRVAERARRSERGIVRHAPRPSDGVTLVGEGDMTRREPEVVLFTPVKPPLLGVLLKDVQSGAGPAVVRVVGVMPGSQAEKAGLGVGDTILAIDGVSGRGAVAVAELIRRAGPGAKVTITFGRAGDVRAVEVTLAGVSDPEAGSPAGGRASEE